jgi:hypothetical protein
MTTQKTSLPLPETATHAEIDAFTGLGLSARWYREIASRGFFPQPEKGQYAFEETIQGLLRFYRDQQKELGKVKKSIADQELRKRKRDNDRADGLLVEKIRVVEEFQKVATPIKALLRQKLEIEYPPAVAGMDVPQARIFGRRLEDDILVELQKLFGGMGI